MAIQRTFNADAGQISTDPGRGPDTIEQDLDSIITILNKITDSTVPGDSGADRISATAIADLDGTTVQALLESIRNKLRSVTDGASGADFVKATPINIADTVQGILEELKALIDGLQTQITSNDTDISNLQTNKADKAEVYTRSELYTRTELNSGQLDNRYYTETEVDAIRAALQTNKADKAEVYTRSELYTRTELNSGQLDNRYYTETEVDAIRAGLAADLTTHELNTNNPHSVTASQVGAYSKTEMQTSGQAQVHWDNLTNVPAMADAKWSAPVATAADLPASGNEDGDLRIVLDEDTVYTWDAGEAQWKIIGASGSGISDHGTLKGLADDDHTQYLRTDGARALTGNQDFAQYQALNLVAHQGTVFPASPIIGQQFYRVDTDKLYIYKSGGWTDISGQGAVIRDKEIVATSGQTIFDLSDAGQYEVGTNAMYVYHKNTDGRYELLDESDYTESSSTTITLNTGATEGDVYYFKWFENTPEVINQSVRANGLLQTNLNADMVDDKHFVDIQADAQARVNTHSADIAPHQYGNRFQIKYNSASDSLDIEVI